MSSIWFSYISNEGDPALCCHVWRTFVKTAFLLLPKTSPVYLHMHTLEMSISKLLISTLFFSQLQTTHLSGLVSVSSQVCEYEICLEARDGLEEPQEISFSFFFPLLPSTPLPSGMRVSTSGPHCCTLSVLSSSLWLPSFLSFFLDDCSKRNTLLGSSFWNPSVYFLQHTSRKMGMKISLETGQQCF